MQDCHINFKLRNEQKKESRERDSGYGLHFREGPYKILTCIFLKQNIEKPRDQHSGGTPQFHHSVQRRLMLSRNEEWRSLKPEPEEGNLSKLVKSMKTSRKFLLISC